MDSLDLAFKIDVELENNHILKNISGYVEKGTCLTIMGPSGAGKSTLLNTLSYNNTSFTGYVH